MRELIGDERTSEWLEGIKDNGARSYASNVVIVDAVARGEIPMGLVNNYYNEQAIAEDPGIPSVNHYFAAEDLGTLILVTAVGILDTANDRGDAQLLVEFLLSKESQQFYAEQTFEYPLARGVQAVGDKPPLADVQSPNINLRSLGGGLERTRELIAASGLEQS